MIDINAEAEKTLSGFGGCPAVYMNPEIPGRLPAVSYYNLSESGEFSADNTAHIQRGREIIDVWAKSPDRCGRLAREVNSVMEADGWVREFSADVPEKDTGVYHRTMRYVKDFLTEKEN